MKNEIALSNRLTEIVEYYFSHPTLTQRKIAEYFGITPARISSILHNEKVLNAFPILAKRRIKGLVPQAVARTEYLMNQNLNLVVSEKVVSKILDTEKVLESSPKTIIHEIQMKSVQELQDIIQKAKELPSQVLDAEIVENDNTAA